MSILYALQQTFCCYCSPHLLGLGSYYTQETRLIFQSRIQIIHFTPCIYLESGPFFCLHPDFIQKCTLELIGMTTFCHLKLKGLKKDLNHSVWNSPKISHLNFHAKNCTRIFMWIMLINLRFTMFENDFKKSFILQQHCKWPFE